MTQGERIMALAAERYTDAQIGEKVGLTKYQVRRMRRKIARGTPVSEATKPKQIIRDSTDSDHTTIESPESARITTLNELLAVCNVDLNVWAVERHVVNKWEVGTKGDGNSVVVAPLYQVKAWLVRIAGVETVKQLWADALQDISDHSRSVPRITPQSDASHMFELTLPDLHLGKLCWAEETGENYDTKIAVERAKDAISDLVEQARAYPIERCLFLFGNDFLHYDNLIGTTTAGTPQDRDSRYHKMVRTGRTLATWAIDQLADIAPTVVMVVPGNHDRATTWTLGEMLAAWYHNDKRVVVENEPTLRKYHRYGRTLLGFTHGDEIQHAKLPGIMSVEKPDMWARTRYREWHVGHFHTSRVRETLPVNSINGVRIRVLQSLSGTDAWHSSKGYVGETGAAEGFIWHKERGLRANLVSNRGHAGLAA